MKIHTTQNLNSLPDYQSTNNVLLKDFRLKNYSEQMPLYEAGLHSDAYYSSVSFGKGPSAKDAKKIIKASKKIVGDISKEPQPEVKRGDNFKKGPFFNWFLSKYEYEPVIQAAAAAGICMALRPATIMALPAKGKSKEDNTYAASHSFASGLIGLASAIILTAPFKAGGKYVTSVMRRDFKPETLKKLYPQLDIKSIQSGNIRKPIDEWLNNDGNKFIDNITDIQFLPEFKQLSDVSERTYKNVLGLDVDWASQKGKSFNDVILKDGNKLYNKIDMSKVGIIVKEDGYRDAQILLQDLDKEYLNGLIKDSKNTNWGNLDINSVYNEKGLVKDFREWKDINGNQWKLDLDEAYIASPIEEVKRFPRISGKKRFDAHDKEYKHITYQNNGKDGRLGTEINETIVEAATANEAVDKLLTWGPDIATRIPVASATIALIPWTLKHIFGIEKKKKGKDKPVEQVQNTEKLSDSNKTDKNENVSFKGKGDPEKANWFIKMFGKYYGKPIMESDAIRNVAAKLSLLPGKLTQHMMTLGSLVTSSVYMTRTLQNEDLDPERKKTLAVNQGLCFIIPTVAAYTVDKFLNKHIKDFEYSVSNLIQHAKDMEAFGGEKMPAHLNSKNVKGIRILASIGVFSLIYRYITPVLVTPLANWISDKFFASDNEEQEVAKEIKLNPSTENNQVAKEVSINSNKEKLSAKKSA